MTMIQARYWMAKKPSIENKCHLCSWTPSAQSVLSYSTTGTLNQLLRTHKLSSVKLTIENWSLQKFPSVSRSDWESLWLCGPSGFNNTFINVLPRASATFLSLVETLHCRNLQKAKQVSASPTRMPFPMYDCAHVQKE